MRRGLRVCTVQRVGFASGQPRGLCCKVGPAVKTEAELQHKMGTKKLTHDNAEGSITANLL